MKVEQSLKKNKPSHVNKSLETPYRKPALHKYGSISSLTAGLGGSIPDSSGPGTKTR